MSLTAKQARGLLSELSEADIARIVEEAIVILKDKAVDSNDPEVILDEGLRKLFNGSGGMAPPTLVGGSVVAVPSYLKRSGGSRHKCNNATVLLETKEYWSWDENSETYIDSKRTTIGQNQHSLSLHIAVPGLRIIRHLMNYDGKFHDRVSTECYLVKLVGEDESGEPQYEIELDHDYVSSKLPLPSSR